VKARAKARVKAKERAKVRAKASVLHFRLDVFAGSKCGCRMCFLVAKAVRN